MARQVLGYIEITFSWTICKRGIWKLNQKDTIYSKYLQKATRRAICRKKVTHRNISFKSRSNHVSLRGNYLLNPSVVKNKVLGVYIRKKDTL